MPQVLKLHKSQVLKINLFSPITTDSALLLIFLRVLTAEWNQFRSHGAARESVTMFRHQPAQ